MINYDCTYRRNKIVIAPGARFDSLHTAEETQKFVLGTELELDDGTHRKFRYAKAGGSILLPHHMNVAALLDAQQFATAQTAYGASEGDVLFEILATTGHTITDGELKDGWLFVNDGGDAMGDLYLIKNNKFPDSTDDTVIQIELSEKLRNDVLATDDFTIIKNKYLDVIVVPTTQTNGGGALGVARCTVPIGYYFWAQYRGYCALILDTTDNIVVGEPVGRAGTLDVAGCVGLVAGDETDEQWGICVYDSTNAEAAIIDLKLA